MQGSRRGPMLNKTMARPFLMTKDAGRDLDAMFAQAQAAMRDAADVEEAARVLDELKLQVKQIKAARRGPADEKEDT